MVSVDFHGSLAIYRHCLSVLKTLVWSFWKLPIIKSFSVDAINRINLVLPLNLGFPFMLLSKIELHPSNSVESNSVEFGMEQFFLGVDCELPHSGKSGHLQNSCALDC